MPVLLFVLSVLSLGSVLFPGELGAQPRKPQTASELVTYNGKDREAVLYTGAKTEGKATWYTSLAGDSYKAMIKAFETKYAGVKIEAYRANGGEITNRMFEEAKARKSIVDTIETTESNLMFQREAFLLRPYHSPYFASYPEDAKVERSYRTNGGEITQRMVEEAKAKRQIVDTIETTEPNLMFQRDAFLLRPYHSPHLPPIRAAKANAASTSGVRRGSPTSASATIEIFYPKRPCRKTTTACSIPRSKAEWASPSTIPATSPSPAC